MIRNEIPFHCRRFWASSSTTGGRQTQAGCPCGSWWSTGRWLRGGAGSRWKSGSGRAFSSASTPSPPWQRTRSRGCWSGEAGTGEREEGRRKMHSNRRKVKNWILDANDKDILAELVSHISSYVRIVSINNVKEENTMKFTRAWYCFSSSPCPPSSLLFSYLRKRDWELQHWNCRVYSGRLALGVRLGAPLKSLQRVHVQIRLGTRL